MLSGKTALVTGGAKNLGADIAIQLAGQGANLALHYNSDKSKEDAIKLQSHLKQSFPKVKVVFYQANLTTTAAVDKLFASVLQDFKKIDIVVNTVGKVLKKPIAEISEAEYDESKSSSVPKDTLNTIMKIPMISSSIAREVHNLTSIDASTLFEECLSHSTPC